MKTRLIRQFALVLMVASAVVLAMGQEESRIAPPAVVAAGVPLYPPLARAARIEGTVHVKVTTDGHKVVAVQADGGHKLLTDAAEKNVQTWEFATHEPTTFTVTYQYKLVDDLKENPYGLTVILRLPKEVEVLAWPLIISDPPAELTPAKPPKKKPGTTLLRESLHAQGFRPH